MAINIVPKTNVDIFALLYQIEVGLREFIIGEFNKIDGCKWYNKRLPGDILKNYKNGIIYERSSKCNQLIPHHPIYYLDFPDLKKIIEKEDNWRDIFKNVFGNRKDIIIGELTSLEFIRNKIAHNRKTHEMDFEIIKSAYNKISSAIGIDLFKTLVTNCTYALDIKTQINILKKESETFYQLCKNLKTIETIEICENILKSWWFDNDYLGHNVESIHKYYEVIHSYYNRPKTRGCGYIIEEWLNSLEFDIKYKECIVNIDSLLSNWR